jgi:hypothetical protein
MREEISNAAQVSRVSGDPPASASGSGTIREWTATPPGMLWEDPIGDCIPAARVDPWASRAESLLDASCLRDAESA